MPTMRAHPLNVGRRRWHLAADAFGTGAAWPDLAGGPDAVLYEPSWGATTRPGGLGQLSTPAGRGWWPRPTTGLTIAAWVYSDGLQASDATILHAPGSAILRAYTEPGVEDKNRIIFYVFIGTVAYWVRSDIPIPADAWTYVMATLRNDFMRIYLNGVDPGDHTDLAIGSSVDDAAGTFTIGFEAGLRDKGWVGAIDDLSVWDRGLSVQEAEDAYNESVAGHPATLDFTTGPPPVGDFLPIGTAAGGFLMLRQDI